MDDYICPITQSYFVEPVVAADGFTYEKKAILKWMEKSFKSPVTGLELSCSKVYPNKTLKHVTVEKREEFVTLLIKDIQDSFEKKNVEKINSLFQKFIPVENKELLIELLIIIKNNYIENLEYYSEYHIGEWLKLYNIWCPRELCRTLLVFDVQFQIGVYNRIGELYRIELWDNIIDKLTVENAFKFMRNQIPKTKKIIKYSKKWWNKLVHFKKIGWFTLQDVHCLVSNVYIDKNKIKTTDLILNCCKEDEYHGAILIKSLILSKYAVNCNDIINELKNIKKCKMSIRILYNYLYETNNIYDNIEDVMTIIKQNWTDFNIYQIIINKVVDKIIQINYEHDFVDYLMFVKQMLETKKITTKSIIILNCAYLISRGKNFEYMKENNILNMLFVNLNDNIDYNSFKALNMFCKYKMYFVDYFLNLKVFTKVFDNYLINKEPSKRMICYFFDILYEIDKKDKKFVFSIIDKLHPTKILRILDDHFLNKSISYIILEITTNSKSFCKKLARNNGYNVILKLMNRTNNDEFKKLFYKIIVNITENINPCPDIIHRKKRKIS